MTCKETIRDRLVARIQFDQDTGCWVYDGAWDHNGVGRMRVGYRVYRVAAVALWVFRDVPLWAKCFRIRTCETPACANPLHFKVSDVGIGGRPKILLASAERCIRYHVRNGRTIESIARDLGVHRATVRTAL